MSAGENKLGRSLRGFNRYGSFFIAFVLLIELVLSYFYFMSYDHPYKRLLLNLILLILFFEIFLTVTMASISYTYRSNQVRSGILLFLQFGLKFMLPVCIAAAELLNSDVDDIRRIYIRINNALAAAVKREIRPEQVLVLLPHCMQNKDCGSKITEDIGRCAQCGRCRIGEVRELTRAVGARAAVVGGGTAARSLVREMRPDLILAVACERELLSGIADVGAIPVIGIINERPNGYCCNTSLDVKQFAEKLGCVIGACHSERSEESQTMRECE